MRYRFLGRSGLLVSEIRLGTNTFGGEHDARSRGLGVSERRMIARFAAIEGQYSVAERGIDRVQGGVRKKALVRLLAIIGIIQSIMFVYNVIFQWFGTHADPFPQEILDRSYMTAGMCGPGTNTACPGPQVPIPVGPNSARLTPEGQLFAPIGVPTQIRNREAQTLHD